MKKTLALLLCVVLAVGILAGCGNKAENKSGASDEGTIKIGLVVPLTGPNSFGGNDTKDAAEMAIKEVGTLLGRPVELIAADAPTEDEYATQVARLASVEGVKFFTTGYVYNEPSNQRAVEANGGFLMDCIGWNPELVADYHPNYFLFTPTYIVFNQSVAQYVVQFGEENLGKAPADLKVGIISNTTFQYMAQYVDQFLREYGVTPVVYDVYDDNISDFTPIVEKLRSAECDVVIPTQLDADAEKFFRCCTTLDYRPPVIFGTGLAYDGTAFPQYGFEGVMSVSYANPGINPNGATGLTEFINNFTETYGHAPGTHALCEYVGMKALLQGIENAGSLDFDAVREGILKIDIANGDTAAGWGVKFNADYHYNERSQPLMLCQWFEENGELVYKAVGPGDLAVAEAVVPWTK